MASSFRLLSLCLLGPVALAGVLGPPVRREAPPQLPDYVSRDVSKSGKPPDQGALPVPVLDYLDNKTLQAIHSHDASILEMSYESRIQSGSSGEGEGADDFWLSTHAPLGKVPMAPDADQQFFRDVKDFGALGDGSTDDTVAINHAASWVSLTNNKTRCDGNCAASTTTDSALVYFPPGTYLISSPIVAFFTTSFVGNPSKKPVIKGARNFTGIALLDADAYVPEGKGKMWYIPEHNVLRQVRNLVFDMTDQPKENWDKEQRYVPTGMHWPVGRATSITNCDFKMPRTDSPEGGTAIGILMEDGNGGVASDLTFSGGSIGFVAGSRQFTGTNLKFEGCQTAIKQLWNWGSTWKNLDVAGCQTGIDCAATVEGHQGAGSITLLDSKFTNVPHPITLDGPVTEPWKTGLVIDSLTIDGTPYQALITLPTYAIYRDVPDTITNHNYTSGLQVLPDFAGWRNDTAQFNPTRQEHDVQTDQDRFRPLWDTPSGSYFHRSKPLYADVRAEDIVVATSNGVSGNSTADQTDAINKLLQQNVGKVVFFPAGVYMVEGTVKVPLGSKVVGSAWSQIMGTGAYFGDASSPKVMVQVGSAGDSGAVEMSDMLFTVKGPTAGCILLEWNVHESSQGSAAMWDSHFRVGGAAGSELDLRHCPPSTSSPDPKCMAAFMLMHVTKQASGYFDNVWLWTADHDLDAPGNKDCHMTDDGIAACDSTRIAVYAARGLLVESQGPSWFVGVASEHAQMYQIQLNGAKDIYMSHVQAESPTYLPHPDSLEPYKTSDLVPGDPRFVDGCSEDSCKTPWALQINGSNDVFIYSAGFYSLFKDGSPECGADGNCQGRLVEIAQSNSIWLYNLFTKGSNEVISPLDRGRGLVYSNETTRNVETADLAAWILLIAGAGGGGAGGAAVPGSSSAPMDASISVPPVSSSAPVTSDMSATITSQASDTAGIPIATPSVSAPEQPSSPIINPVFETPTSAATQTALVAVPTPSQTPIIGESSSPVVASPSDTPAVPSLSTSITQATETPTLSLTSTPLSTPSELASSPAAPIPASTESSPISSSSAEPPPVSSSGDAAASSLISAAPPSTSSMLTSDPAAPVPTSTEPDHNSSSSTEPTPVSSSSVDAATSPLTPGSSSDVVASDPVVSSPATSTTNVSSSVTPSSVPSVPEVPSSSTTTPESLSPPPLSPSAPLLSSQSSPPTSEPTRPPDNSTPSSVSTTSTLPSDNSGASVNTGEIVTSPTTTPVETSSSSSGSSSESSSSSTANFVMMNANLWEGGTGQKTLACIPPCTYVLPPVLVTNTLTFSCPPIPTSIEIGTMIAAGSSGSSEWVAVTQSTTLQFPPLMTTVLSFSNIAIVPEQPDTTIWGAFSVQPPPLTITYSDVSISGTKVTGERIITPKPWPEGCFGMSTSTDQALLGGLMPFSMNHRSGAPTGAGCTAGCGERCSQHCGFPVVGVENKKDDEPEVCNDCDHGWDCVGLLCTSGGDCDGPQCVRGGGCWGPLCHRGGQCHGDRCKRGGPCVGLFCNVLLIGWFGGGGCSGPLCHLGGRCLIPIVGCVIGPCIGPLCFAGRIGSGHYDPSNPLKPKDPAEEDPEDPEKEDPPCTSSMYSSCSKVCSLTGTMTAQACSETCSTSMGCSVTNTAVTTTLSMQPNVSIEAVREVIDDWHGMNDPVDLAAVAARARSWLQAAANATAADETFTDGDGNIQIWPHGKQTSAWDETTAGPDGHQTIIHHQTADETITDDDGFIIIWPMGRPKTGVQDETSTSTGTDGSAHIIIVRHGFRSSEVPTGNAPIFGPGPTTLPEATATGVPTGNEPVFRDPPSSVVGPAPGDVVTPMPTATSG